MAFIDTRCSTVCPLTAAILRNALHRIGPASAAQVDLVAINANPTATRVSDVYRFSVANGMVHQWKYLTGTPAELKAVYHAYQVYVCVLKDGDVVHTSAIFVVDPSGRERLYFETLDSSAGGTLESETRAIMAGMRQWLSPAAGLSRRASRSAVATAAGPVVSRPPPVAASGSTGTRTTVVCHYTRPELDPLDPAAWTCHPHERALREARAFPSPVPCTGGASGVASYTLASRTNTSETTPLSTLLPLTNATTFCR